MSEADRARRVAFWLLAAAAASYFVVEAVVAAAWPAPGYSYRDNYVSDLGVPPAAECGTSTDRFVCSPAYAAMNADFFVIGAATLLGLIALSTLFRGWRRTVTILFALLQGVGVAMVGVAPGSFAEDLTNDQVQMRCKRSARSSASSARRSTPSSSVCGSSVAVGADGAGSASRASCSASQPPPRSCCSRSLGRRTSASVAVGSSGSGCTRRSCGSRSRRRTG